MSAAADWYRSAYPQGPDHDPRCLDVLASWQQLYNLPVSGASRPDGGFRACGKGVEIRVQAGNLATYDMDELTRLVLAGHRYRCRVEISAQFPGMTVRVFPRSAEGHHLYERHPGLRELADRALALAAADEAAAEEVAR